MNAVFRTLVVGCVLLLSMGGADDGLVVLEHDLAAALRPGMRRQSRGS